MKRTLLLLLAAAAAAALCGCSALLERSYESAHPHANQYWEDSDASTLRAEDYQSLVNGLLMLVSDRTETALVRLYGYGSQTEAMQDMDRACAEVTLQDPMGAYLVDYITYDCVKGTNCYEFSLKVTYQNPPAQLQEMVSATTAAALPDLLRTALEEDVPALTVKVGYLDRSAGEIEAEAAAILEEYGLGAEGWSVQFYPAGVQEGDSCILEITWGAAEDAAE